LVQKPSIYHSLDKVALLQIVMAKAPQGRVEVSKQNELGGRVHDAIGQRAILLVSTCFSQKYSDIGALSIVSQADVAIQHRRQLCDSLAVGNIESAAVLKWIELVDVLDDPFQSPGHDILECRRVD